MAYAKMATDIHTHTHTHTKCVCVQMHKLMRLHIGTCERVRHIHTNPLVLETAPHRMYRAPSAITMDTARQGICTCARYHHGDKRVRHACTSTMLSGLPTHLASCNYALRRFLPVLVGQHTEVIQAKISVVDNKDVGL